MALIYATTGGLSTESMTKRVSLFLPDCKGLKSEPTVPGLFGYAIERTTPPSTRREAPLVAEDRGLAT